MLWHMENASQHESYNQFIIIMASPPTTNINIEGMCNLC